MNKAIPILLQACFSFGVRRLNKHKTTHSHLFLTKEYSGDPYASGFNPYTEAEVLSFPETGWGIGNVEDLQLSFLYGPED